MLRWLRVRGREDGGKDEDLETLADELVVAARHGDAAVRGLTGRGAVVAVHRGHGGRLSGGRAGLHRQHGWRRI